MNNTEKAFWMLVGAVESIIEHGQMPTMTGTALAGAVRKASTAAMEPNEVKTVHVAGLHMSKEDADKMLNAIIKDLEDLM